jgi:hypothetical protein
MSVSTSAKLPKLSEMAADLEATLATLALLATAALKLKSKDEISKAFTLVIDNSRGTRNKRIETCLREAGLCVVIEPLLNWKVRDQSGRGNVHDAQISISIRVNPEVNFVDGENGGTTLTALEVVEAVIKHVVATRPRHPGSEFFRCEGGALTTFDPGLMIYDVVFVKEVTIL